MLTTLREQHFPDTRTYWFIEEPYLQNAVELMSFGHISIVG